MTICMSAMLSHDQDFLAVQSLKTPASLIYLAGSYCPLIGCAGLISVMHGACRYCSPADHLANLGIQKTKTASRQSIPALADSPSASAASLAPAAGVCLQSATAPTSLAPHVPCAPQLPGHCMQGEQSHVTATPEGQLLAINGSMAALQSAGDVVHQSSAGRSLTRTGVVGATEQQVAAPAAIQQRQFCAIPKAGTHLSKRYKYVSPRQLCAEAGGEYGASGEDPFQPFLLKYTLPNYCTVVLICQGACCRIEQAETQL